MTMATASFDRINSSREEWPRWRVPRGGQKQVELTGLGRVL